MSRRCEEEVHRMADGSVSHSPPARHKALRPAHARAAVVGISAYCEQARWGVWERRAVVRPRRYADSVAAVGGIPVLLPPAPGIEDALARLDGLILSGGGDIDPARYGAEPAPQLTSVREERDAAELALLDAAMSLQLPVLGICRGMQVINVARGAPPPGGQRTAPSRPSRPTTATRSWWPSSGTPRPGMTRACSAPSSPRRGAAPSPPPDRLRV